MKNFQRVTMPGWVPVWRNLKDEEVLEPMFVDIRYEDGTLSITGVVGPMANGNCRGSCAQCLDELMHIKRFADGWDAAMVKKLYDIWREWHLNDMCPASPEMVEAGWLEKAATPIIKYGLGATSETHRLRDEFVKRATQAALEGVVADVTPEMKRAYENPLWGTVYAYPDEEPEIPEGYRIRTQEKTTLGWVKPSDHPDGLLGRKLNPDDEHGYGTWWWRREVPEDVLAWLRGLPDNLEDLPVAWR